MTQRTEELTVHEKTACECLLKEHWPNLYPDYASDDDRDQDDSVMDSPTKFLKSLDWESRVSDRMDSLYIPDCTWISPTTVVVERLFSKCKNVMTCDRRRMHPRIFEAIVFLKENEAWWDIQTVQAMLSKQFDERLKDTYGDDGEDDWIY